MAMMMRVLGAAFFILHASFFISCSKDEDTPHIDSVWMNMVSRPVEPVTCAYPGQTICLRGSGLGDLKRVIVGGTDINLNTLFVYESSSAITFQIPSDISTTGDNIRVVTRWVWPTSRLWCDLPAKNPPLLLSRQRHWWPGAH